MVYNGAQLHLLVNHIPVLGFPFLVLLLIVALFSKIAEVKRYTLVASVAIGLSSLLPFWTGEPAEEVIEKMPGVSEHLIEEHEEIAEKAMVLAVFTAVVAAIFWVWDRKKPLLINRFIGALIILSLINTVFMGIASHEGGKIRHPEIRTEAR